MTRVPEAMQARKLLDALVRNRTNVNRLGVEISTGVKAQLPGDTNLAGTIAQAQETLGRTDGYLKRISSVKGFLEYQDSVVGQANEVMIRAKEIASQASNETNSVQTRAQFAAEVWELRDHLVSLANSQYQGRYVYGGADDDDPPYDAATYAVPATGSANQRYVFDAEAGTNLQRSVAITDDLSITTNTPGNQVFDEAIQALERLGRSLEGYRTLPALGAPDGTGAAYTFPTDFDLQTQDILGTINLIDTARTTDILPERTQLGGRLRRLETAETVLDSTKTSIKEMLSRLQDADLAESASQLQLAQTALEASLAVTTRMLQNSILNFL